MKHTSLYETHRAAGATIVPFAGWDMPVSYNGTVAEVAATRQAAGLFDVSHMGEARVTGPEAFAFVQAVTANDVSKLSPGKAQYSLLLNAQGGLIDDIIVYCEGESEYLIVLNAGCKDKDWSWLTEQSAQFPGATLTDESDQTALIAVQGPNAVGIVNALASFDAPARFHAVHTTLHGIPCVVSRTGYTGEDGYEIFCPWTDAPALWNALTTAGAAPAGLGARDVLRLEAAYPLYGHELDDTHLPSESGVAWAVKAKKGEFLGRDAIVSKPAAGKLVGLKMQQRAIPREHCPVLSSDGNVTIGEVTSGTYSPTVQAGIAMARLEISHAELGTTVLVDIRGRHAPATIVALPFYRNGV